jgi:hypothetical protein
MQRFVHLASAPAALLLVAFAAVGGCRNDPLAGPATQDAAAEAGSPGERGCGPGRPGCPEGMRCQVTPSCLPPEERQGTCVAGQEGCTTVFVPVCGCDGKTTDQCAAFTQGLAITHEGPCRSEAAACTSDVDCVLSVYDQPVGGPADCSCTTCGSPLNRVAANAYQSAWTRHCKDWSDKKPCIPQPCPASPPVACIAGRCATVDAACGSALTRRPGNATAPCGGDQARCAQVQREPNRPLSFTLTMRKTAPGSTVPLTMAETVAQSRCVAEHLRGRGADRVEAFENLSIIMVTATFDQVRDALAFESVLGYDVDCSDPRLCPACGSRPVATCRDDAFCAPILGQRVDGGRGCVSAAMPVGCAPRGLSCPPTITYARDPAGTCWEFGGCAPEGWARDPACEPKSGSYQRCP